MERTVRSLADGGRGKVSHSWIDCVAGDDDVMLHLYKVAAVKHGVVTEANLHHEEQV